MKEAMIKFGLQNVKSYHINTLYKIYKSKPKQKENVLPNTSTLKNSFMSGTKGSMKNSTFKDNYSISPMKPSRFGAKTDGGSKISDTETEK